MDRKARFGGSSGAAAGGCSTGSPGDATLLAYRTAAAQARREALLVRAERRRWRQQASGGSAVLLAFPRAPSLRSPFASGADLGPRPVSCQWLYGDGPFADADKCGAPTLAGESYCRAHLPRLFLVPDSDGARDAGEGPERSQR